ncbi:MAG TPA: nucleotidyltransferase domain-containing protein [Candidatus Lokiarchaeia archaeon]|nr:nucleotidyltransferase domain-containing protein [Candidatus Lokiarchaeia archaeon]
MQEIQDLRERVLFFFRTLQDPAIASVYLYGSRVEGFAGPSSDLDVGLVLCPGQNFGLKKLLGMMVDLDAEIRPVICDLRILNDMPLHVIYPIMKRAQLLDVYDEKTDASFRETLILKYFDFKPIIEEFYRAI